MWFTLLLAACVPAATDTDIDAPVDSLDGRDTSDSAPADTSEELPEDTGSTEDTEPTPVAVAACPQPTLPAHYPGAVPVNPWADWPLADTCLHAEHDVIIVLGCPSEGDGSPSSCQEDRVWDAVAFHGAGYGEKFIVTGGAVANEHVEALAMKAELMRLGIPENIIYVEPLAQHTDENLFHSTTIMREQGWQSALVVSEAAHLLYSAVCDANCCVRAGRLTTWSYPVQGGVRKAASYVLTPPGTVVSDEECTHLTQPTKVLCVNLATRLTCAE